MESLESKLDRLSPEQRKEAEDFVDFLLLRSGQVPVVPAVSGSMIPAVSAAPPPLSLSEPAAHVPRMDAAGLQDHVPEEGPVVPAYAGEPASAPFHEIGGGIHDHVTSDYMDYGRFERDPSPADEAVKKIRKKIIAREGQDKPHHLLDWVD